MFVPVIDIAPFVNEASSSQADRDRVLGQVGDACRNVGFLVITNHGIAAETITAAFKSAKEYFDQPSQVKKQIPMTSEYPYGYESAEILSNSRKSDGGKSLADLKETFQVCVGPDGVEPHVPAQWPEGPVGFKSTMTNYYRSVEQLAATMMRIFAGTLKLPSDFFDKKIDKHMSSLRILNYPHQEQEPGTEQIRASAHTDYGSLTILAVDDAPGGLQVRDLQGEWHSVKAPADSYVVNLGDLMQHWTNDQWRSTLHRVINPQSGHANNRRQSIAFFHNINADTVVECIPTCQSPENPAKYPPILAGEYLMKKHSAAMGN
ncbi:hypothetical protein BBO99_00005738 [Phytophthora kernoviae]|uniref:Fe2OG dioxygenase domain-containing protein n=2 Tax=Phytophthora kernoviae TaxID=325452 RepID=A0A3R7GUD0_9STRA|nr:hypothetical protein G195_006776 [Phytophthora kernoviae 00238/432]KAG2525082.1 hypothetical protein JM18_004785 [Phytophthora kernoviae]KAG2527852.1 hypothetical protein JM16_002993 [Phytophthora kernoviae]RLN43981.1 hypothetical protein BBI17_003364 [Phytophthora kernoviae]RLN78762.1 hypothetical protein BBO99_00005738 [Phytophthora kernoviae]